jgi:hypothetical protein
MGIEAEAINPKLRRTIVNIWSQRSKKVFFMRKPIIAKILYGIVFFVYGCRKRPENSVAGFSPLSANRGNYGGWYE